MDLMVKLVLIFFVSLLSFSVGTFVGKQFSDSQHKLASLEHENERETASVPLEATEVKPEDGLSDEDIANLTEEFVKPNKKEKDGDLHAKADGGHGEAADTHGAHGDGGDKHEKVEKVVGTVSKTSAKHGEAEHGTQGDNHGDNHGGHDAKVSNTADRLAHGETPEAAPKPKAPTRIPTSLPSNVSAQTPPKFFVQVASYQHEDEASKRVDALKNEGFSAYTVKNESKGKIWYRIGIGAFATENEAREGLKKVQAAPGLKDAFIQKIVN